MKTHIVVRQVWEYFDLVDQRSCYQLYCDKNPRPRRQLVSEVPLYGVIEKRDNGFLDAVVALLGVFPSEELAKASARLLQ